MLRAESLQITSEFLRLIALIDDGIDSGIAEEFDWDDFLASVSRGESN